MALLVPSMNVDIILMRDAMWFSPQRIDKCGMSCHVGVLVSDVEIRCGGWEMAAGM